MTAEEMVSRTLEDMPAMNEPEKQMWVALLVKVFNIGYAQGIADAHRRESDLE